MKLNRYFFIALIFLSVLAGCAANRPCRTTLPTYPGDVTNRPAALAPIDPNTSATIETHPGFNIGYVEFDDQGWFWAHRQWEAVTNAIENEAANDTNGLTIIVFVHGWKNNADFNNGNVNTFRSVLTNLSSALYPRKVFGVYVGWRGLSVKSDYFPLPFGEELSFYNRKNAAERIGHQGSATQVFTELETMQDELNDTNSRPNFKRTELVIIGHSFGGELVYSAISQILIERLVQATRHNGRDRVRSLGDLVVLLNPAFEASQYNNLMSLATSHEIKYQTNQSPVLAILTSKSDWATGLAFPLGMRLAALNEKTRPSRGIKEQWLFNVHKQETRDEKAAIVEAVGHDDDYINYDLNYTNYDENTSGYTSQYKLAKIISESNSLRHALLANNAANSEMQMMPYIFAHSEGTNNYACILQPRTTTTNRYVLKPGNPFLNVALDPHIMDGHNDVANPVLLTFLRDFILFSHTNSLYQYPSPSNSN
jgi:hypothetical protein